ncbi:conserved hypothetical protein [Trichinella spiralis]|uniref:hypothetical protein n=1 Tax=Trichinella spiralis TaxID=6334 RepID=UPI0001EFE046|nr:conserved hypothetical protein [Trichinella spiralis]
MNQGAMRGGIKDSIAPFLLFSAVKLSSVQSTKTASAKQSACLFHRRRSEQRFDSSSSVVSVEAANEPAANVVNDRGQVEGNNCPNRPEYSFIQTRRMATF